MGKEAPRGKRKLRIVPMLLAWATLLAAGGGGAWLLWWAVGPSRTRGGPGTYSYEQPGPGGETPQLSLFFSCDLQGRLAPYACEEDPKAGLGGIARMATVYNAWEKDRRFHLRLDVGNSTIGPQETAESVNPFVFKALDRLRYDVVNCGDNEATLPLNELRKLARDRRFKLISANLVNAETRAPIFPTHWVLKRAGLQIAVIGLLREDILPKHPGKGVRLISPAAALRSAINVVKDSADVIVVLAFLPPEEIHELARKHTEVQVFLGALSAVSSPPYEVAGPRALPSSLVSYLGDQGCTVGCLDASFTKGRLPTAAGRTALLNSSVPSDPSFADLLADFTSALRNSGRPLPGSRQDSSMPCTSSYVGSEVCKLCHIDEYYAWQKTGHAGAYVTLLDKGEQRNPVCLGCHVTGYLQPGGFDPDRPAEAAKGPDAPKVPVTPKSQAPFQGVGCECCHGGSRHHLRVAVKGDRVATREARLLRTAPSVENCIRCHKPTRPCLERGATDKYERTEYMNQIKHRKERTPTP